MDNGNYQRNGIGFLAGLSEPSKLQSFKGIIGRRSFQLQQFGRSAFDSCLSPRNLTKAGLALCVVYGLSLYDRAAIQNDVYIADSRGDSFMRHSLFGIEVLPFKSVYTVDRMADGYCKKLVATQVMTDATGTYVYGGGDSIFQEWLLNRRVVTVGACEDRLTAPLPPSLIPAPIEPAPPLSLPGARAPKLREINLKL